MTVTRVKDFAAKVLAEIDIYEKEAIAKVLFEMQGAPKDAIANATSGSGTTALKRDPHVLVRYESDCSILALRDRLQSRLNDESAISDASLKEFADLLLARFSIIKDTNCLYNYSPKSLASKSFIALAKNLFETLNPIALASGREAKYLHYYDYLFPDFPCRKYTSETGHLGELSLTDFFWGEDIWKEGVLKELGRPIPTLSCLEAYRLERTMRPPHVFLTQAEMAAKVKGKAEGKVVNPVISRADNDRLKDHSSCASDYFMAINTKTLGEEKKDEFKIKLVELISQSDFVPGYLYETMASNTALVRNGFLRTLNVGTLRDLADYLSNRVAPVDWKAFLEALPEDDFFRITLPKAANAVPDLSVLSAEKFEAFVNNDAWYVKEESRHNNAALLILAELYRRKRNYEGLFTGKISNITSGFVGGSSRNVKMDAVDVLMDFFVCSNYCLNQLDVYLEKTGKIKLHGGAIKSDRLLFLVNKANSLWNALLATAKLPEDDGDAVEAQANQPAATLVYNAETLARDAQRLCGPGAGSWSEEVRHINKTALKGYIISCGGDYGLYNCITTPGHYIKGNNRHNRAILYILTQHYIDKRGAGNSHTTNYGKFLGAPDKVQKLQAARLLLEFFESDMPLNHLHEFLVKKGALEQEAIIVDRAIYSETKALAKTAESVLTEEFYMEQPKETGLLSYFSWK